MSSKTLGQAALVVNPLTAGTTIFGRGTAKGGVKGGIAATIGAATGNGGESDALKAQRKLEEERRAQLAQEAENRAAAKRKAETAGQRAGASTRSTFLGGLGFGVPTPAASRGNLFGN